MRQRRLSRSAGMKQPKDGLPRMLNERQSFLSKLASPLLDEKRWADKPDVVPAKMTNPRDRVEVKGLGMVRILEHNSRGVLSQDLNGPERFLLQGDTMVKNYH